jgi:hypothetical protein
MMFVILKILILSAINIQLICPHRLKGTENTLLNNLVSNLIDTSKLKIQPNSIENYRFSTTENNLTPDVIEGSVLMADDGKLSFVPNYLENDSNNKKLIARARYTKSLHQIGWSRLYVETFDKASPEILSWAAGYVEGRLTAMEMLDFYKNLVGIHNNESQCLNSVFDYYVKIEQYIRGKTSKEALMQFHNIQQQSELEYWLTVSLVQAQTDGLLEGYKSYGSGLELLNLAQIYFINADGEVPELLTVFKERAAKMNQYSFKEDDTKLSKKYLKNHFGTDDHQMAWNKLMSESHCTAIIKLLKDSNNSIKNIFIGHTTWDSYSEMHRIMKRYKFDYTLNGKKKDIEITFSSYPGTLTSTDDFYILNRKIVITETTLEMLKRSVYDKINSDTHVPNYIRISVAHRLATSGKDWTEIFKQNNSGTYNSQWMIIDTNALAANNPTYEGLFHVLEQSPGLIVVEDKSADLHKDGYWGSFNRPYFKEICDNSGFTEMLQTYGLNYSYNENPRAQLIISYIHNVTDMAAFKNLMQFNKNSNGTDYINTIAPRFDLAFESYIKKTSGAIDSKVVSLEMIKESNIDAISGPSRANGAKTFDFTEWPNVPSFGLPKRWSFDWVLFNENNIKNDQRK